jgi:hypothetical protein
LVAAA